MPVGDGGGGGGSGQDTVDHLQAQAIVQLMQNSAAKNNATVTVAQEMIGVSIVEAESGGNPAARDPKTGTYSDGTYDRGIWQLNSKYHLVGNDAAAFDPQLSTDYVFTATGGFSPAGFNNIWHNAKGQKSKGLSGPNLIKAFKDITGVDLSAGGADITGVLTGDKSVTDIVNDAGTGAVDVGNKVADTLTPDWVASLGRLLGNLLNGEFWKRLGIGALGLVVILIAVILLFGKDAANAAGKVAP